MHIGQGEESFQGLWRAKGERKDKGRTEKERREKREKSLSDQLKLASSGMRWHHWDANGVTSCQLGLAMAPHLSSFELLFWPSFLSTYGECFYAVNTGFIHDCVIFVVYVCLPTKGPKWGPNEVQFGVGQPQLASILQQGVPHWNLGWEVNLLLTPNGHFSASFWDRKYQPGTKPLIVGKMIVI